MAPDAGRYVDADGVAIWWASYGPADSVPLVLLHSLGLDSRMWQPQVEALAREYRLVLVDLRGHGRSQAPTGPYTMDRLGLDVLAVADAAALDRFHLCGLSIGGQVAQGLAIEHPGRLHSLVLADTAARIGTPESWAERMAAVEAGGLERLAPTVLGRWFSAGFEAREPGWYAYARERFLTTSPVGYAGCCAALAGSDLRERIGAIDLPTLIISGTDDVPTPPADGHYLREAIGGSELVLIEGAAHVSNLDAEAEFTRVVREFWSRW